MPRQQLTNKLCAGTSATPFSAFCCARPRSLPARLPPSQLPSLTRPPPPWRRPRPGLSPPLRLARPPPTIPPPPPAGKIIPALRQTPKNAVRLILLSGTPSHPTGGSIEEADGSRGLPRTSEKSFIVAVSLETEPAVTGFDHRWGLVGDGREQSEKCRNRALSGCRGWPDGQGLATVMLSEEPEVCIGPENIVKSCGADDINLFYQTRESNYQAQRLYRKECWWRRHLRVCIQIEIEWPCFSSGTPGTPVWWRGMYVNPREWKTHPDDSCPPLTQTHSSSANRQNFSPQQAGTPPGIRVAQPRPPRPLLILADPTCASVS